MTYTQVIKLQKLYGAQETQKMINTGQIWQFEGSAGRHAMDLLKAGVCMLPLSPGRDYYGGRIPARDELKKGTSGTFQNCADFWLRVDEGDIGAIEALDYI